MILNKGLWFGKGTILVEEASLGETVELDIEVVEDQEGYTISGKLHWQYFCFLLLALDQDKYPTHGS